MLLNSVILVLMFRIEETSFPLKQNIILENMVQIRKNNVKLNNINLP